MDKKKILIVSRSFYPAISPRSFRTTELAKEFSRQGHQVKVITSFQDDFDYTELGNNLGIEFKNMGKEKFGILKFSSNRYISYFQRAVNRFLLMLLEFPDIELMPMVIKALRNEKVYDLMISIAVPYPVHWGVAWVRNKKQLIAKTWVADCGDPYYGDKLDTFRKWIHFKYIEKWFCRKTDFITVPIEEAKAAYFSEFHEKIKVIPQGLKFSDFEINSNFEQNTPITFAYAGGFIPGKRDPRPFLEFLKTVKQDFKFIIYTKKTELVTPFLSDLNGKIEIRDYIPRNELFKSLSNMDFLVNFDNNEQRNLPSKLIDYAICNRPVLNITKDLNSNHFVEFLSRDYTHQIKFEDIDKYKIENVCASFLCLYNETN